MSKIHVTKVGDEYELYQYSKKYTEEEVIARRDQLQFELNVINWIQNNAPEPSRIIKYLEVFQGLTSVQGILEKKQRLQQQIDFIDSVLS